MALNTVSSDRLSTNVKASNLNSGFGQLGNRNLIINGAMQVSQRGTSFADSASGSYTLDRFLIQNSSGTPAFTITQDTDAPHGFNNSLKVACTTADASPAAGSFSRIRHTIEAQNLQPLAKGTSSAKASTLSFYVKTNKTGVYTVFVYDDDNNRMFSASYTVSDTNWNRYTIIIPADTTGAINDDNGAGFHIHWGLSLGSNRTSGSLASTWATYTTANEHVGNVNFADNTSNVWAITGIQLEVGSVATDFEHRSFGQDLALCQRYFYMHTNGGVDGAGGSTAVSDCFSVHSSSQAFTTITPPVTMRSKPTLYSVANSGYFKYYNPNGNQTNITDLNLDGTTTRTSIGIYVDGSFTAGQAILVRSFDSNARLGFSAEL
jgi:hypothetical protein